MKNNQSKRHGPSVQEKSKESKRLRSTIQEVNIVIPPDGGYAWIIVFAAFMSNFAVDGIAFSFSAAVLPGLSKALNLQQSKLAVISSIQIGVYYLFGPIACAFINRYGFRSVGICGSLIAFAGMFIASHLQSFGAIVALYGVIVGLAFGMLYTAATISVGYYFEKYRALATGIASCGSSFGGLCLAPLFVYVTDTRSWEYTLKIQAFLMFISLLSAFTMKPLKPSTKVPLTQDMFSEMDMKAPSRVEFVEIYKTDSMVSIDLDDRNSEESRHFPQISIISSRFLPMPNIKTTKRKRCSWCAWLRDLCSSKLHHGSSRTLNVISTGPMDRKDIFYAASVVHLPEYKMRAESEDSEQNRKRTISYHLSMILDADKMLSTDDAEIIEFHEDTGPCLGVPHIIHKVLGNLFDVSLLKSSVFCVLALSCLCYALGYIVPYVFLQQRGEMNNIPADYTNWFISWISVGNALGRLSSGVIATVFSHINVCYLTGFSSICAGVLTVVTAYIGTDVIAVQICYCILFGFTIAFFSALRPVVFVRLLGLKKLTNAFGLSAIALGIGILSGTPIVSALFEMTGSLLWTFMVSGILFIASGMLIILAFFIHLCQKRKNQK